MDNFDSNKFMEKLLDNISLNRFKLKYINFPYEKLKDNKNISKNKKYISWNDKITYY
tara:strand:- start:248 stop:418 length:171 start_codon:yes stop_codon:yes gene_type:complete